MKLLLLQPPVQDFYDTDIRLQPVGLCYLKASVERHLPEVQVTVKDFHQGWGRRTIPVPRELSYLKDYYAWPDKSPFSTFFHYYHFGAPFEKVGEEVGMEKPDMVGISSLFSPYYREALRCAHEVKKRLNVPVLVGGSHVSAVPRLMLEDPSVDFVICGEAEHALVRFLEEWKGNRRFEDVPGLGYKKNGELYLNPVTANDPLDHLAPPDFSDLPHRRYLFSGRPLSFIISSRGCPHQCSFCSVHLTFGRGWRRRASASIAAEIKKRYREGIRVFDFEDDNLTYDLREMKQLCRELIGEFPARDVQFLAMNGISYQSLDSELLHLMREAGFTHLNLALVSHEKEMLHRMRPTHSVDQYVRVVGEAVRLKFRVVSYQILGLPGDTLGSMIETLRFHAALPVLLGASMFYLVPASPISRRFGSLKEPDIFKARLTAMAVETGDFGREDIYTLFVTTRIINFLKGISFQDSEITFGEALERVRGRDRRSALGVEILERLFEEEILYAATRKGFRPLSRFKPELFFGVWEGLASIGTQEGKVIRVSKQNACSGEKVRSQISEKTKIN